MKYKSCSTESLKGGHVPQIISFFQIQKGEDARVGLAPSLSLPGGGVPTTGHMRALLGGCAIYGALAGHPRELFSVNADPGHLLLLCVPLKEKTSPRKEKEEVLQSRCEQPEDT